MIGSRKKKLLIGATLLIILVIVALVLGLYFGLNASDDEPWGPYAVVANGAECAEIGTQVLRDGGTAADAAIATLFCEGLTCPQSMGLGGGFLLTHYQKATQTIDTLIARETAPAAATETMFVTEPVAGIKAVAVPGEVRGYWELHQKFGKLPWRRLIEPTIDLCRNGHIMTTYLSTVLRRQIDVIRSTPGLRDLFYNEVTDDVYVAGDIIKRVKLADTLEIIAEEGVDSIYNNGTIAQLLISDIKSMDGIITTQDLMDYRVRWEKGESISLTNDDVLYSIDLPGTGILIAFMLDVLNGTIPVTPTVTSYQRMAETFKFAYAERSGLGDQHFSPEAYTILNKLRTSEFAQQVRSLIEDTKTYQEYDHYGSHFSLPEDLGTAHINVLAPNGDAVSATSTINNILGSKIVSPSTNIILNDEMDDFSVPGRPNGFGVLPSPANYIRPGKRPLSSMCPTMVIDSKTGDVKLLIGGAGGSRITTSLVYAMVRYFWFNETLDEAIQARRIHHQLTPMRLEYETGFDMDVVRTLESYGHVVFEVVPDGGFAALTGISQENGVVKAIFDSRRGGSSSVFM